MTLRDPPLHVCPEVLNWVEVRRVCGPRKKVNFFLFQMLLDHLRPVNWGSILLENKAFAPWEVVVDCLLELVVQDIDVGVRIQALRKRTHPPNSLVGHAAPDVQGAPTCLDRRNDVGEIKSLMRPPPDPLTAGSRKKFEGCFI